MKRLLFLFSISILGISTAFSQDDLYYTGDQASVTVKVQTAPPALPVYQQPPCPYDGYMWTPGYWAWADGDYYWVPGVWVRPARVGYLWTPGYWGFVGGYYGWHGGYWGEHIGFYGGVNYGYGYGGSGFYGGRWAGGSFSYNTAVWHVNNTVIHNTYSSNQGVSATATSTASFNGPGGVQAHPIASEQAAMNESHVQATSEQQSHQQTASQNKGQYASVNHGQPATTAMNKPNGQRFSSSGHAAKAGMSSHTSGPSANHTATTASHTSAPPSSAEKSESEHTAAPASQHSSTTSHQAHSNSGAVHSQPQHTSAPHASAPHNGGGGHGGGGHGGGGGKHK